MMQVLAGYDPLDPGSANVAVPDFTGPLGSAVKGLRIGVPRHFYQKDLETSPEVVKAFDAALEVYTKLGASVTDITLSPLGIYADVCNLISRAEAYAIHERYITKTPELYGEITRRRIMTGAFARASDYVNALRYRASLVAEMAEAFKTVDVMLTPGWSEPAPGFDDVVVRGPMFTQVFNVTGSPALSICETDSADGLPLSLQIAGRPFEDDLVLKVGDAFEKATAYRSVRPSFAKSLAAAAQ